MQDGEGPPGRWHGLWGPCHRKDPGKEGRVWSPPAGVGTLGPTANVAAWQQYSGTFFWPLCHHISKCHDWAT